MNRQSIIDQVDNIIDTLEGNSFVLSQVLKKVNRIANEIDFPELKEFVRNEFEGYTDEIPKYRIFRGEPLGVFQNRMTGLTDRQPLVYDGLAKQLKVEVSDLYMRPIGYSIPEMEDYEKNNQIDELLILFTPEQKNFARQFLKEDEKNGWYLSEAYFKLPDNAFRKIIDISANRLIELLLDLQSKLRISNKISTEQFFEDGNTFDALIAITEKIKKVKSRIILIDGYVDETTLSLFSSKKPHVKIRILTNKKAINSTLKVLVAAFNTQYQNLEVRGSTAFHDRFLIIDNDFYHVGASIKDAGKKTFMLSLIEEEFIKEGIRSKFEQEWEKSV